MTGPAANQVVWYRVPEDPTKLWTRHVVAEGLQVEGAAVADINGDGQINAFELGALLGSWGPCSCCAADLNDDDVVDAFDLGALLGSWGPCP